MIEVRDFAKEKFAQAVKKNPEMRIEEFICNLSEQVADMYSLPSSCEHHEFVDAHCMECLDSLESASKLKVDATAMTSSVKRYISNIESGNDVISFDTANLLSILNKFIEKYKLNEK